MLFNFDDNLKKVNFLLEENIYILVDFFTLRTINWLAFGRCGKYYEIIE